MPEESHSLCDLSLVAQDDETIQSIDNQKQLQGKIDSLRETSCPPLEGGEFMDGRRETSPDSSEFPRPLWHYCPRKILTIKDEVKIKLFKYFRVFISRRLCG